MNRTGAVIVWTYAGELEPFAPFDFGKSLGFLGAFPPTRGEQQITARSLTKAVMTTGRPVVFTVQQTESGNVERPALAFTLAAEAALDDAQRAAALDRIRFFLSLDDDLRPFYALAREDTAFAPVVERLYGYHQAKFVTPFENACWAVLTQRTPMLAARRMKSALVERYGRQLTVDGAAYEAFPEPAALASAALDELAALLHNERKAHYVCASARYFAEADERWLREGDYDEVAARLRAVNGIGAWSASFILIRGLGRMERMPAGGQELAHAVRRVYGPERATPEGIAQLAAHYGRWQGYWGHYLRVMDLPI